jgi:hypothetical protein
MDDDIFDDEDDEDDEAFLAMWDAVDRQAAEILRSAIPGVVTALPPQPGLGRAAARLREALVKPGWPYRYFDAACQWDGRPPRDDRELIVDAVASTMSPKGEVDDWPIEQLSTVMSLQHADWLGAVLGVVRAGAGSDAGPARLLRHVKNCPEIEDATEADDGDDIVLDAFESLMPLWEAVDVIDQDRRLTTLGRWVLPTALLQTWNSSE